MLLALALLASAPTAAAASSAPAPVAPASVGFTARTDAPADADGAVPLDWAGPAARTPGADADVRSFDPTRGLFGEAAMCVVLPGQPPPPCATAPMQEIRVSDDALSGVAGDPDQTCQTVETVRMNAQGRPQRVFATVCGDEAEAWNYRQRSAPDSAANPTRPSVRAVGPSDVNAPARPN
jgi:hypothetical protein